MKSAVGRCLVVSACAAPSLRAGTAWGGAGDAVKDVKPGNDKWDKADPADIDKKLAKPVINNGDFFFQYMRPKSGFRSPMGEQAACVLDKAVHIMDFHFCHSQFMRPFQKSYKMDCDVMFLPNLAKDLDECCVGEEHVPLWGQMHKCQKMVKPISKFVRKTMVPLFAQCMADAGPQVAALPPSTTKGFDATFRNAFAHPSCNKAARLTPAAVTRLYKVSATLYVTSNKLDLTEHAKTMMATCDPIEAPPTTKAAMVVSDSFTKKCHHLLGGMWRAVVKSRFAEPDTPRDDAIDDDWV